LQREVDRRIGDHIRRRRRFLGMTKATLATGLGVSYQALQRYESGDYHIGPERLNEIARLLGVPLASLNTGRTPGFAEADMLQRFAESHDGLALLRALSRIEDRTVRKRIISAVQSLSPGPVVLEIDGRGFTARLNQNCQAKTSPEKDAKAVRAIRTMKLDLAVLISHALRARRIRQKAAAKLLHTNQPRISAMANSDIRSMSLERLLRYALILGWIAELRFTENTKSLTLPRVGVK
jgi:transcriptional regulator with XRE-family HTH domain/predicted XRE-type DNA-binding protein